MTTGDDGGQVQISGAVLIATEPEVPPVPGVRLTIDHHGVLVEQGPGDPRVVRWDAVTGWRVDPYELDGRAGAIVVVDTAQSTFRVAAPGGDPTSLAYAVDALCRRFTRLAAAAPPSGDPLDAERAAPHPSADGVLESESDAPPARRDSWKSVLVIALIVVLAAIVSLLLAQSAGAIHLPILGGGNGGTAGGFLPAPAR